MHAPAETTRAAPFTIEVLVSAGPRKGAREYETDPVSAELCEDCAGSAWIGNNKLVVWLSDGASNGWMLPRLRKSAGGSALAGLGFHTRALAKDLGPVFVTRAAAALGTGGELPPTLVADAFSALARQWEERLSAYLALIETRGLREQLLAQLPETLRVDWSATFTGGIFDVPTRQLTIWNCGNAGGLVMAGSSEVIAPNSAYITFAAALDRAVPLRVRLALRPITDAEPAHFTNASGFALLSDGMVRYRLEELLTRLKDVPITSLSDFRLALAQKADLTWDDKSLVFGRFL